MNLNFFEWIRSLFNDVINFSIISIEDIIILKEDLDGENKSFNYTHVE